MEKEHKFGQTDHCMKVSGPTIKLTEMVDSFTLMVISMKASGSTIKHKEKVKGTVERLAVRSLGS